MSSINGKVSVSLIHLFLVIILAILMHKLMFSNNNSESHRSVYLFIGAISFLVSMIYGGAFMIPIVVEKYFNVKGKNVNWKIKLFYAIWLNWKNVDVCLFVFSNIRHPLAKLAWVYRLLKIAILGTRPFFFKDFRDDIIMSFSAFSFFPLPCHTSSRF